jgi:hypothetical protein
MSATSPHVAATRQRVRNAYWLLIVGRRHDQENTAENAEIAEKRFLCGLCALRGFF